MKCNICADTTREIFTAKILKKHKVRYYLCSSCNFLQTENPFWFKEAYESPISRADTGILKRNQLFADRSSAIIFSFYDKHKKFLDFAGGYGIFVRMMRDKGFDFYWDDPFADNLFANGFEYKKQNNIELITALECFEHFWDPVSEMEKMLKVSKNIIFSTRLFDNLPPDPNEWWYYSLDSGQHISFYSVKTLKHLAKRFNLHLCTNKKDFHMFCQNKQSNLWFKSILKLADTGVTDLLEMRLKSFTDSDHNLLTKQGEAD
jgi:hypothetical protein